MNSRTQRRITIVGVIIGVIALLVSFSYITGFTKVSAAEPNSAVVIPTHENMSIPDHVFQSKYERCNLPSREELANMTDTLVDDWGDPYFANRQIQFNAESDHAFRIKIQKDQALGEMNSSNRFFLYGDTYVGRGPFYFRCFDSRHLKFNPNVKSICHKGTALLKRLTDRVWTKSKYPGLTPSLEYTYERRAFLPRFFVPRDSQFVWSDNDSWEMTLPGYLSLRVPFRNKVASKDVWIDGFC